MDGQNNKIVEIPLGWLSLENMPPDELVEVIDSEHNTAFAHPTWYTFKTEKDREKTGKWTSKIIQCEPYWDGGFMVKCDGISSNIGEIIGWRTCQQGEKPILL